MSIYIKGNKTKLWPFFGKVLEFPKYRIEKLSRVTKINYLKKLL